MIKNERQLRITMSQLDDFKKYLLQLEKKELADSDMLTIEEGNIRNQIKELEKEISDYESTWASNEPIPVLQTIAEIPLALIRARISLGLTQKDLAERLGLKEQQIQRYEATEYESASLARIKELISVLNLNLSESTSMNESSVTFGDLFERLEKAGLKRPFILGKILSSKQAAELQERSSRDVLDKFGLELVSQIGRIFHLSRDQLFGRVPIKLDASVLGNVRYKLRQGTNATTLATYSFYAHYLAMTIIQATEHLPTKRLPMDPYDIHKAIISENGALDLGSALRYTWDIGIPVLPLEDHGAFDAARFREGGRNVIILKQRTTSEARWLFDLFHEFWHIIQIQSGSDSGGFEMEDIGDGGKSKEETDANRFAGATLLGKNPSKLVNMCIREAQHDPLNLKSAVRTIAARERVSIGALANCVAYRLSAERGISWWGQAESLQESKVDTGKIARDILLANIDFSRLPEPELDILRKALRISEMD
jgi:transcriptional regulator with XRE-family HTH domain